MAKRGETREVILKAATRVFFENGFEKTSVKMILNEANIVTGSFYHFFSSKEALFEAVVEDFLKDYSLRISTLLEDDTLTIGQITDGFFKEFAQSTETYFDVLQADKLHWTVKCALHDMTIESMIEPLTHALSRLLQEGSIESLVEVDPETLARILIKGSEAIVQGLGSTDRTGDSAERIRETLIQYWKRIIVF
ncbi:MAG: TetR/AcrR family transcriptional regulator [Lachnospiraceae bacterium]|nr:TetR/AcrR family transcriptional regulator [Lachnospiraceae bacterium]